MRQAIQRIQLVVVRPNGRRSEMKIHGAPVTGAMLDSAEDLLHTMTTGERPVIRNLYDLVARAFGTTRQEAKERITAAAYGMQRSRPVTARDQRRIADGDRALALPDPQSPGEIRDQLSVIHDGMLALQSLDDLGEEDNRHASENFRELEKRYEALKSRLEDTKKRKKS